MNRVKILLILVCGMMFFYSCKKCKTCTCWKYGVSEEQTNCAFGIPPTTSTLDVWEDYLTEEIGYDSVQCVME